MKNIVTDQILQQVNDRVFGVSQITIIDTHDEGKLINRSEYDFLKKENRKFSIDKYLRVTTTSKDPAILLSIIDLFNEYGINAR